MIYWFNGGRIMIKTLKMKNCASYDSMGISIEECKKVNFIYGPNGSGKSTISNFLYDQKNDLYKDCEIEWEFDTPTNIVVYNKNFKEKNFLGDMAGVFTLGKDSISDLEKIEELKKKRDLIAKDIRDYTDTLSNKTINKSRAEQDFRETIWNVILRNNENDFKEAFIGFRSSKQRFAEQVLLQYDICHESNETRESLIERAKTLYSSTPEFCSKISFDFIKYIENASKIENDEIWSKIVIGNNDVPIAKMISSLNNSAWVSEGRDYLQDNGTCPFCQQQTIDKHFLNQLNEFFNDEYKGDISKIDDLKDSYLNIIHTLETAFNNILENSSFIHIGGIDTHNFEIIIQLAIAKLNANYSSMESKSKEPNRKISLSCTSFSEILRILQVANQKIENHNNMVTNYNSEKQKLTDDIWAFLMDEYEKEIKSYDEIRNIDKAIDSIRTKINSFKLDWQNKNNEIIRIEENITSIKPTINEINKSLVSYGFTNFKIVESTQKPNSYQIQRPNGTLATDTLSEGEETFISFLYYLQMIKGATDIKDISSKKILVIDDPICSLDSTILYIVSAMVKDLIKTVNETSSNIEQIFILTHNVFFHKEASFLNNRSEERSYVNFWIIRKDEDVSKVTSYGMRNPIKTSYELLWQELRDTTSTSRVTTQNTMRRIIENYFGMLGYSKYDYISSKFDTPEEKIICESLLQWINDGSHTIPDDLYIDSYSDSIEKYKEVFRNIFVFTGNESHYNMMMGIKETES